MERKDFLGPQVDVSKLRMSRIDTEVINEALEDVKEELISVNMLIIRGGK